MTHTSVESDSQIAPGGVDSGAPDTSTTDSGATENGTCVPDSQAKQDEATVLTNYGNIADYLEFEKLLERTGWFEDSDLWADHWEEFLQDYLRPTHDSGQQREKHRHSVVKFVRLVQIMTNPDCQKYLEDNPNKENWGKEDHHARLAHRVLDANKRLGKGVFNRKVDDGDDDDNGSSDYNIQDCKHELSKVWKVLTKQRDDWKRENPPKREITREKVTYRIRVPSKKSKSKMITAQSNQKNEYGGQLTVVWQHPGLENRGAKTINNLKDKDFSMVMDEVASLFQLKRGQIEYAKICLCEDVSTIIDRLGDRWKDIKLSDVIDESVEMNARNWNQFRARAAKSCIPLLAQLLTYYESPKRGFGGVCFTDLRSDVKIKSEFKQEPLDKKAANGDEGPRKRRRTDGDDEVNTASGTCADMSGVESSNIKQESKMEAGTTEKRD